MAELPKEVIEKLYEQGRSDKYQEIVSQYMLLTEKQVADIREDERTDIVNAIKNDLCDRLVEEQNKPYQNQGVCDGLYFAIKRCDWYLSDEKEQDT